MGWFEHRGWVGTRWCTGLILFGSVFESLLQGSGFECHLSGFFFLVFFSFFLFSIYLLIAYLRVGG